jgi:CHAT domain-containing protein
MSELYNILWSPISGLAGEASRVIISPEGSLALVPFGSLLDSDSRFLIEKKTLYYVSSGRDFMHRSIAESGKPVVVGDPAFNSDKYCPGIPVVSKRLSRLKGTRREAQLVAEILGADISPLLDKDASETQIRQVQSPRILHIASHGLFLDENAPPSTENLSPLDRVAIDAAYPRHVYTLSRSGIALAGICSGGFSETDDGFLTAFDATSMNLHGTELVTLSGCETGLGSVFVGEGVLGLRRSFRIAGARYVIMSLWRLPDREAVRQMCEFYKAYEASGDPVIALRDVLRSRIKWYRSALNGTPPPAVWAALTVDGIPRT